MYFRKVVADQKSQYDVMTRTAENIPPLQYSYSTVGSVCCATHERIYSISKIDETLPFYQKSQKELRESYLKLFPCNSCCIFFCLSIDFRESGMIWSGIDSLLVFGVL